MNPLDINELCFYPGALLNFINDAAEFEVQFSSLNACDPEKLIIKSGVAALVHQVYREPSDGSIKTVMFEFILNWADRII